MGECDTDPGDVQLSADVAFFDIGDTLASAALSGGGTGLTLTVLPGAREVLQELTELRVRIGVISDPGPIPPQTVDAALEAAGLWELLDPALVVYGRKDTPVIFQRAAGLAVGSERLMFVGENSGERAQAELAGFLVAPDPAAALAVLAPADPPEVPPEAPTPGPTPTRPIH